MNYTRIMFISVVLGIISISLTMVESCPTEDEYCVCSFDTISCGNLENLPLIKTTPNDTVITSAYFEGGNIISVSKNELPHSLKLLVFESHPLTNISDDAFEDSATSLTKLSISGAQFKKLPKALLMLTNLTHLSLIDIPITEWDTTILQRIAISLSNIWLENVGLTAWPPWFSLFHSLNTISLSRNSLKSFPEDAVSSCQDSLRILRLDYTDLTQVPKPLSTLRNLTELYLDCNNITNVHEIEQLAFFPLEKTLQILIMNSNRLTAIPDLSNMARLREVYLDNNNISKWTNSSFPSLVTILQLQGNKLTVVPDVFSNMSKPCDVDLSYNQITEIRFDMFPPNITNLDLSYNKVSAIFNTESTNYSSSLSLDLSHNEVTKISFDMFPTTIIFLDLSYNKINVISPTNFTNYSLSLRVDLSHNQITKISFDLFPPNLTNLDLRFNKVSVIFNTNVTNDSPLQILELSYNLLTEINFDMFPTNLFFLTLRSNKITAITETTFRNYSLLETLNVSYNPLSTISPLAFKPLIQLKYLVLDGTNLAEIPIALTSLTNLESISMLSSHFLSCPCPQPEELVQWYTSFNSTPSLKFIKECSSGLRVRSYLSSLCQKQQTTTLASTTAYGKAAALVQRKLVRYASTLIVLTMWLCCF